MKQLVLTSLILISQIFVMAQTDVKQSSEYKNFLRYYEQAASYMQANDHSQAKKFIKNAEIFSKKLVKKGQESAIASELNQMNQWKQVVEGEKMAQQRFSSQVESLSEWASRINEVKRSSPSANYHNLVAHMSSFDREETLRELESLRQNPLSEGLSNFQKDQIEGLYRNIYKPDQFLKDASFSEQYQKALQDIQNYTSEAYKFDLETKTLEGYLSMFEKVCAGAPAVVQARKQQTQLVQEKEVILRGDYRKEARAKANGVSELPVADVIDAGMSASFMSLGQQKSPGYRATSAIITSRKWAVTYNVSGSPVSRQRIAALTYKNGEGQCFLEHTIFKQNYKGGGWGASFVEETYGKKPFDCGLMN
ncbi:MAG: hypothetical protein AAFY71_00335 [Bacteroidota bacterium]